MHPKMSAQLGKQASCGRWCRSMFCEARGGNAPFVARLPEHTLSVVCAISNVRLKSLARRWLVVHGTSNNPPEMACPSTLVLSGWPGTACTAAHSDEVLVCKEYRIQPNVFRVRMYLVVVLPQNVCPCPCPRGSASGVATPHP